MDTTSAFVSDVDYPEMNVEETTLEDGTTSKQVKMIVKKIFIQHLTKRNLNLFAFMGD